MSLSSAQHEISGLASRLLAGVAHRLPSEATLHLLLLFSFASAVYIPGLLDTRSRVSLDGAFYLSEARYIYDGQGYLRESGAPRLGRPPGFPVLLAASFLPRGPSMVSAAWAVRIAGFIAVLALGAIALRMFGLWVALLTLLWAVTNEFINEHLFHVILLDMTQTALLLAFILCVYQGLRSGSPVYHLLAAASLAGAFWTKESALLLLPLPLFAALLSPEGLSARRLRGLVMYGVAAGLLVLPWFMVVYLSAGRVYRTDTITGFPALTLLALAGLAVVPTIATVAFWRAKRKRRATSLPTATLATATLQAADIQSNGLLPRCGAVLAMVIAGVVLGGVPLPSEAWDHFVHRVAIVELKPLGRLAWAVIPLAWTFILIRARQGSVPDVVLSAALLSSIPLIAFVIDRNLDPRNYLLFLMISHLAAARFAAAGLSGLLRLSRSRVSPLAGTALEIAAGLLVALLLTPPLVMAAGDLRYAGRGPDTTSANDVANFAELASWVKNHLPPGGLVHLLGSTSGAAVRFELGDAYETRWARHIWLQREDLAPGLAGALPGYDADGRPYRGLRGTVFLDVNPSIFVGDRESRRPDFIAMQIPDLVNGAYPRYLVWTQTGAERVLPDALLAFLVDTGEAETLAGWPNGDAVLRFEEPRPGNVLLLNERVLGRYYDARDGSLNLPEEIGANLSRWRVVIIGELNSGGPAEVDYCGPLQSSFATQGCWNGVAGYAGFLE